MSLNSTLSELKSTAFVLPWIGVPIFNLAKYALMTYLIGFLWDIAHVKVIEAKRYISLWYTGQFSVATWGRSRNNLFCGSNFETLHFALLHRISPSKIDVPEEDDAADNSTSRCRFSVRCGIIEVATIALIIIVLFAETVSELYTSSTVQPFYEFRTMNSPVRQTTSEVIFNDRIYSESTDIIFARRCSIYEDDGKKYVSRPNLVVKRGKFDAARGEIPAYDMFKLCFYDTRQEMNTTLVESQKKQSPNDFVSNGVVHASFKVKVLDDIPVPHFSDVTLSKAELAHDSRLVLVSLDGIIYTCTKIYTWCVRVDKNAYEVALPIYSMEMEENYRHNKSYFLFDFIGGETLPFVLPFRISFSTLPLLAKDRFMMRPKQRGQYISDIEENLSMMATGYTYGWTTQEMKPQRVIFEKDNRIVPTVQVGYIASVCTIVVCSCVIILGHQIASQNRKITGLVGEHAFIDRWRGQLEGDEKRNRIHGMTQLIICSTRAGVGNLQPASSSNPCPLSEVERVN